MKTFVILSGVRYSEKAKQRPQHFADYLAKSGNLVLYNHLFSEYDTIEYNNFNSTFILDNLDRYFKKETTNIFSFNKIGTNDGQKKAGFEQVLKGIQDKYGVSNTVFIIQFPDAEKFLNLLDKNSIIIYDCLDDWEHFENGINFISKAEVLRMERSLANKSSIVIASAKKLYNKMKHYNNNVYYLPNGVNNEDYNKEYILPYEYVNIKKPIVVFIGLISEWIDIELIDYLAKVRPEYEFIYIGSCAVETPKRNNIQYLGKKPYSELINYVKYAKAGIIPFRLNKLSFCVTPLKLFEYLGAGIPSVSTVFPDLLHLEGNIMCETHEEFLSGVDKLISMDDAERNKLSETCIKESKSYDWNKLLGDFFDNLEDFITIKQKESIDYTSELIENYKKFNNIIVQNELLQLNVENKNYEDAYTIGKKLLSDNYDIDYNEFLIACYKLEKYDKLKQELKNMPYYNDKYIIYKNIINTILKNNINNELIYAFLLSIGDRCCESLDVILDIVDRCDDENKKFAYGLLCEIYFKLNHVDESLKIAIDIKNSQNNVLDVVNPDTIFNLAYYCVLENSFEAQDFLAIIFTITDVDLIKRIDVYKNALLSKK